MRALLGWLRGRVVGGEGGLRLPVQVRHLILVEAAACLPPCLPAFLLVRSADRPNSLPSLSPLAVPPPCARTAVLPHGAERPGARGVHDVHLKTCPLGPERLGSRHASQTREKSMSVQHFVGLRQAASQVAAGAAAPTLGCLLDFSPSVMATVRFLPATFCEEGAFLTAPIYSQYPRARPAMYSTFQIWWDPLSHCSVAFKLPFLDSQFMPNVRLILCNNQAMPRSLPGSGVILRQGCLTSGPVLMAPAGAGAAPTRWRC